MSFLSKAEREKCWGARDVLWKCLDDNNEEKDTCKKFREIYESNCPAQWVKHFDRKREYLKFKDRIQRGYDPEEIVDPNNNNNNKNNKNKSSL